MQLSASSSVDEVAAIVSDALTSAGITAVLSGGAAVQIYTSGLYKSRDLDFVASASQRELAQVLNRLGFTHQAADISSTRHVRTHWNFPRGLWRSATSSFASGESDRLARCEYRS